MLAVNDTFLKFKTDCFWSLLGRLDTSPHSMLLLHRGYCVITPALAGMFAISPSLVLLLNHLFSFVIPVLFLVLLGFAWQRNQVTPAFYNKSLKKLMLLYWWLRGGILWGNVSWRTDEYLVYFLMFYGTKLSILRKSSVSFLFSNLLNMKLPLVN